MTTDAEAAAPARVDVYKEIATDTRDLWNRIKREVPIAKAPEHRAYARFDQFRRERDAMAKAEAMRQAMTRGKAVAALRKDLLDLAQRIIEDPESRRCAEETQAINDVLRVVKSMTSAVRVIRGPALRLTLRKNNRIPRRIDGRRANLLDRAHAPRAAAPRRARSAR
jgi:hypothetical protein